MNLSGFHNTPISFLLTVLLLALSLLTTLSATKTLFHLQLHPHVYTYHQLYRLLAWQTPLYANSGELMFAIATVYRLRVVERMWGTRKWASFVLVAWFGTGLAVSAGLLAGDALFGSGWSAGDGDGDSDGADSGPRVGTERGGWNYVPPGPTALIFAMLAQYHAAVPGIYKIRFLPRATSTSSSPADEDTKSVTLSDKLPTYILASQLALSHPPGSILAAAFGWIFGLAYRAEIVPGSRWRVPGWWFDWSGRGEYEGLRRRLAEGEFAAAAAAGESQMGGGGVGDVAAAATGAVGESGAGTATAAAATNRARRPLMGQILDQFRGAF